MIAAAGTGGDVERAAVLIGVDRAGDLPRLRDAARGARRMEEWAREQGFAHVVVLTDEGGGTVDAAAVRRAVWTLADRGTVEQLVVYFAGHGVTANVHELWLLSDAPRDPHAAVNATTSAMQASRCGIPYAVFVSDACRTPAEGLQQQFMSASLLFPNDELRDLRPVDQFFACGLGRAAHELAADAELVAGEYSAVYTASLLEALLGRRPELLAPSATADGFAYLRPRRLRDHLRVDVATRIRDLGLRTAVIQVPEASITSDEDAWVSRTAVPVGADGEAPAAPAAPAAPPAAPAPPPPRNGAPPPPPAAVPPPSTAEVTSAMLDRALAPDASSPLEVLDLPAVAAVPGVADARRTVRATSEAFGPLHHETQCGIKVRGAELAGSFSPHAHVELAAPGDLRVAVEPPGATVLLELADGRGAAVPAVHGFITGLTFDRGELVDVALEPSDNTALWGEFERHATQLRELRAALSYGTREGRVRLEGEEADRVAERLRLAALVTPALAVYAAYAFLDAHRADLLDALRGLGPHPFGVALFDVAMLTGELPSHALVLPSFPLLTRGWPYLGALGGPPPPPWLRALGRHLEPWSTWTLFARPGVQLLRRLVAAGEVR